MTLYSILLQLENRIVLPTRCSSVKLESAKTVRDYSTIQVSCIKIFFLRSSWPFRHLLY